eukprot:c18377_g1_i1 orf=1-165(-)
MQSWCLPPSWILVQTGCQKGKMNRIQKVFNACTAVVASRSFFFSLQSCQLHLIPF